MIKLKKEEVVSKVRERLSQSSLVVVLRRSSLTVAEATELRRRVRLNGATFEVVKNTLLRLAVKGTHFEGLLPHFKGQSAIAISNDPISAAKVCVAYAKENPKLEVLAGVIDKTLVESDGVIALATMPSLGELRGKLVGAIIGPAVKIAVLLKEPASRVSRLLASRG